MNHEPSIHTIDRLSERLSKKARHELCLICLKGVREEYNKNPQQRAKVGHPPSIEKLLADRIGVKKGAVQRWADLKKIQSNDKNATKLIILAYEIDSQKTEEVLWTDTEFYVELVDSWLGWARTNIGTSPWHDIKEPLTVRVEEEPPDIFPTDYSEEQLETIRQITKQNIIHTHTDELKAILGGARPSDVLNISTRKKMRNMGILKWTNHGQKRTQTVTEETMSYLLLGGNH